MAKRRHFLRVRFSGTHLLREQAIEWCRRGSYRDAFVIYKRLLLEFGQSSPEVFSEAGFVCWKLALMEEAEQCFARALEADPFHRETLINRVEIREQRGLAL